MSLFENPLKELELYRELEEYVLKDKGSCRLVDLTDSGKAHLVSEFLKEEKPWKLVVSYDESRARQLYEDISCFTENTILYPSRDLLFFFADVEGHLISKERIEAWKKMSSMSSGIVICTIDALMDKLVPYSKFKTNILKISATDTVNIDELSRNLVDLAYERVSEVESMASFSIRGGIIDIYPLTEENPIRIELWGDEIDSIRRFDIASQRSIENIDEIYIYPAKEKELGGKESFLSYFDKDRSLVFIDEPANCYDKAKQIEEEFLSSMEGRLSSGQISKEEVPELFSAKNIMEMLGETKPVLLNLLNQNTGLFRVEKIFSISTRVSSSYKNAFENLIEDLKKLRKRKYRVILLTASRTRAKRLANSLREDYSLSAFSPENENEVPKVLEGQILVLYGNLQKGFEYSDLGFIVISESDIYGAIRKKKSIKKTSYDGRKISSLKELNIGDYIIHEEHGLGIYRGIEKIERDNIIKDYIKLEYAGSSNCYIPITKLDIIQKYANAEVKAPKLNKLGSIEWVKTKTRVKKAVANIAKELVDLYAKRLNGKGYIYPEDTIWQREFEEMFPFEETKDQLKAIEDVKNDMQSSKIMDRLVCGDVGYGKTEVAIRAAFKAVQEGKQVIYLVPTTILAQQHYNNFVQRMKDFPVKVDLMCRFRTASKQKKTIEDFKRGIVDIVIGTHRVLSKDLTAKNLGLIIIDEEQRFGVTHKEKLKNLRNDIDVLTLTATPIPRTLHMSLVGIRDLSVLEEAPIDRLPIQTYVMEYYDETVKEAIKRELARDGQVYYVYNTINDIEEVAKRIQAMVPEANVAFAHGRMAEKNLENIMIDFINGDIDVLVSTTIIETGLDIPNANTMIIHDSDKLGLSQLYQLRGRVGRSSRTSYAFMLYKRGKLLNEEATKRLKAIREFTELGSGIKIAMRDLEIRGAGNVLGAEQHGHMEAVGYDLYCKLLNTAIKALKGEDASIDEFETSIEVPLDAYIPDSYIANEELKLDVYKRIVSMANEEDYMDIQDELIDRFGAYGKEVENLLNIAKIKALAHSVYVEELYINKQELKFIFYKEAKISAELVEKLIEINRNSIKLKLGERTELVYIDRQKNNNLSFMFEKSREILEFFQLKTP